MHFAERMALRIAVLLEQQQLLEAFKKIVALPRILPGAQCVGRDLVGARRPAKPEIDAAGKQRFKDLESLGDHQRRMVGQHHAAGADAHVRGHGRDLTDHDLGRGAGDIGKIMMLGDPIALVAEPVGELRQIERIAQGDRTRRGGGHRRKIEN